MSLMHHLNFRYIMVFVAAVVISATTAVYASFQTTNNPTASGYSVLKLFLEDEQHLTTIRRTKMVFTFSDISDRSRKLIDDIANTSDMALEELKGIAQQNPAIEFEDFSDEMIAKATLDSLRMATAKELLFEADDFEKNLLLSQLKILPVIAHLAEQLEKNEANPERKAWLLSLIHI